MNPPAWCIRASRGCEPPDPHLTLGIWQPATLQKTARGLSTKDTSPRSNPFRYVFFYSDDPRRPGGRAEAWLVRSMWGGKPSSGDCRPHLVTMAGDGY
jgi:hypothetical protein